MNLGHTIPLYSNIGFVRYIDHLGSDTRIVEAARVSYDSPSKGPEADKKLLLYLYKNRHTSPFEQCSITFNIRMPIFIMRQFVRHRTFRLNEVSARYTELPDDFFYPEEWRKQNVVNKQGGEIQEEWKTSKNVSFLASDGKSIKGLSKNELYTQMTKSVYNHAYEIYEGLVVAGVAKELARIVLPVGIFTEIYVSCDVHNLMHFLRLRLHPHAQKEARDLAEAMFQIFADKFPWCAEAYNKFKMVIKEVE